MTSQGTGPRTETHHEDVKTMPFQRCLCKKILCQLSDDRIIILCRFCKRYVVIHTRGIDKIEYL